MVRRIRASDIPAWSDLFDLVPVSVIVTDVAGMVVHWNHHAARLFGWAREEALGHSIFEFTVGPEESEIAEAIMAQVTAGEPWEGEFAAQRRDRSKVLIRIVDAPLFDADGAVVGVMGISVDVTSLSGLAQRETLDRLTKAVGDIPGIVADANTMSAGLDAELLTPRQRQVTALLLHGLRVPTIARRLGISESTVRNHLSAIFHRLGVHSQRAVVEWFRPHHEHRLRSAPDSRGE